MSLSYRIAKHGYTTSFLCIANLAFFESPTSAISQKFCNTNTGPMNGIFFEKCGKSFFR